MNVQGRVVSTTVLSPFLSRSGRHTEKCPNFASRPNFASFGLFVAKVHWYAIRINHVNYQNIKGFDQASGTLKIIKGLPWLPGLPWKHEKNDVTL